MGTNLQKQAPTSGIFKKLFTQTGKLGLGCFIYTVTFAKILRTCSGH